MGDPGGIGPEIILKALRKPPSSCLVVAGIPGVFEEAARASGLKYSWPVLQEGTPIPAKGVILLDVSKRASLILGRKSVPSFRKSGLSRTNAAMALASLDAATALALEGQVGGIATAPLNKTALRRILPDFTGHTEYLAEKSNCRRFAMMFVGSRLKVTLVTIHLPLREVSRRVTRSAVLEKIRLTHQFLKERFGIRRPRIAVCALNPHGEETGSEEPRVIVPAVRDALRERMNVTGPFSADQLFYDAYEGRYDGLIAMYHDQALAPFKMISFRDGVNVTLGLPFVRTSPDHGTAFDIAYQGKADPQSMAESIRRACQWASR